MQDNINKQQLLFPQRKSLESNSLSKDEMDLIKQISELAAEDPGFDLEDNLKKFDPRSQEQIKKLIYQKKMIGHCKSDILSNRDQSCYDNISQQYQHLPSIESENSHNSFDVRKDFFNRSGSSGNMMFLNNNQGINFRGDRPNQEQSDSHSQNSSMFNG